MRAPGQPCLMLDVRLKMKIRLLTFILAVALPAFGKDMPEMLKMRIDQMKTLQQGKVKLVNEWPEDAAGLFQGISKKVKTEIESKEDHLAVIASIPKHLMKNRVIGKTLESDGWFYTSIEHKSWTTEKATWFSVVASKKNSKILRFSYSW